MILQQLRVSPASFGTEETMVLRHWKEIRTMLGYGDTKELNRQIVTQAGDRVVLSSTWYKQMRGVDFGLVIHRTTDGNIARATVEAFEPHGMFSGRVYIQGAWFWVVVHSSCLLATIASTGCCINFPCI